MIPFPLAIRYAEISPQLLLSHTTSAWCLLSGCRMQKCHRARACITRTCRPKRGLSVLCVNSALLSSFTVWANHLSQSVTSACSRCTEACDVLLHLVWQTDIWAHFCLLRNIHSGILICSWIRLGFLFGNLNEQITRQARWDIYQIVWIYFDHPSGEGLLFWKGRQTLQGDWENSLSSKHHI